jgi:hypothetical protein
MVVREHFQTGEIDRDIVHEHFKFIHESLGKPDECHIDYQEFKNSDTNIHIMWYQNKVKGFVLDTRNDFNNHEIIRVIVEK